MGGYVTDRMTTTLLSMAIVERLDAIVDEVKARGDAGTLGALDSYSAIISWAADLACEHGTAEQWTRASQEAAHTAANLGSLTLVSTEAAAMRAVEGALAGAQDVVLYTPTPSTAIAWFLDVARAAGFEAPGEDVR